MGAERYVWSSVNPNDTVGGGGCACSERKHEDCKGPYAIFPHQEMASNLSPHLVICKGCMDSALTEVEFGELLYSGQAEGEDGPQE